MVKRRKVLVGFGSASSIAIAGCSSEGQQRGSENQGDENTEDDESNGDTSEQSQEEAVFEITGILDGDSYSGTEQVEIGGRIENTGDATETQTVELITESDSIEEEVELEPDEETNFGQPWGTADEFDPGTYEYTLRTEDDELSATVIIEEEIAEFILTDLSPQSQTFEKGTNIDISVNIKNRGNIEGTKEITTEFAGEVISTDEYTIEPSKEETHTDNIDTSETEPEEYDLLVHSEDDEIRTSIEIRPTNEEIMETFELQLELFNLNLVDHSINGDDLHIHYETTATQEYEIIDDMMNVEEVYYSAILQGIPTEQLIAEVSEPGEEPVGRYRIENEWSIAYSNDEISERELENNILDTLEQL